MAPQPHSPWPRQPQGHVSQVGGPSGGSLFSLFCCSPREGAPWLGLGPKQWWEFGLFWAQAAPQVQSTFSVSCASGVTVSRLVQAVGHVFVILRHLSAPPVELAGGSRRSLGWLAWNQAVQPQVQSMFWGLWGPSGTDLPMPLRLFSCVGGQSTPALPLDLDAQDISQAPHNMGQGSSRLPPSPAPQPSLSVVEGFLDTAAQSLPVLPRA